MMHALIWNIRSMNTKRAFERLVNMNRQHHFKFIGPMEPMQKKKKIERYRRKLGIMQAFANVSNKIWAFVDEDHQVEVIIDMHQQLTLKLTNMDTYRSFIVIFVYAKCTIIERIELWDSLFALARDMFIPCLIGGDFNFIWDRKEKFGGLLVSVNEVDDFRHCMNTCNVTDLGFKGSIYTWWNGRAEEDCIFKRLDRCFANIDFQQVWPALQITHLSKIGSDHSPIFISCNPNSIPFKKAFRFFHFWIKHPTFKDVVK